MPDQREDKQPDLAPDLDQTIVDLDPHERGWKRLRRRLLLRRFWQSAAGFWRSGRLAWLLSSAILLTILLNLAAAYGMNVWNRAIFDALEKRDGNWSCFCPWSIFRCWLPASCSRSSRSTPR